MGDDLDLSGPAGEDGPQSVSHRAEPTAEVERAWGSILRDVRAAMLAIPARIQQQLGTLTPHDVDIIDREVRTALEETAGNHHSQKDRI